MTPMLQSHDTHAPSHDCPSYLRTAYCALAELRHGNGTRVCLLYCATEFGDSNQQGPIVNFNLLRPDGGVLGYHQVEKLAAVSDICLRTGCFCNTGACMKYLGLDSQQLQRNLQVSVGLGGWGGRERVSLPLSIPFQQGHECGDSLDIIDGRPTGSVRVSFGYMSTRRDVEKFLGFIKSCFVEAASETEVSGDGVSGVSAS